MQGVGEHDHKACHRRDYHEQQPFLSGQPVARV